jgi:hypothetical protein
MFRNPILLVAAVVLGLFAVGLILIGAVPPSVTPQAVVMEARPDFCITHAPGAMLVTDLKDSDLTFS